jgi:type IV secretory pathway TraG/TraD family ATPase VirD4
MFAQLRPGCASNASAEITKERRRNLTVCAEEAFPMSDVLGTAAWSTEPGSYRYAPIGNAGSPMQGFFLLLGESHIRGNLHVAPPTQHLISIAPTRSGKGVSLLIPNLLTYRGAVLAVDPKGENAWITAPFRRDVLGQKTVIVDPWGEVNRRYGSMAGRLRAHRAI